MVHDVMGCPDGRDSENLTCVLTLEGEERGGIRPEAGGKVGLSETSLLTVLILGQLRAPTGDKAHAGWVVGNCFLTGWGDGVTAAAAGARVRE